MPLSQESIEHATGSGKTFTHNETRPRLPTRGGNRPLTGASATFERQARPTTSYSPLHGDGGYVVSGGGGEGGMRPMSSGGHQHLLSQLKPKRPRTRS
jgi:hypothetical protein